MSIVKHPTLYTKDQKGKLRIWFMETEGEKYRTVSGLFDNGTETRSGWKYARATNVGQSNGRTPEQQALFHVSAYYEQKLKRTGYSEDPATAGEEKIFKPMLAVKYGDIITGKKPKFVLEKQPVYVQPKLDGIRCVMTAAGMYSRNGEQFNSCPHIEEQLAPFFEKYPDAILDGELYNHSLKAEFEKISSLVRKENHTPETLAETSKLVEYHVYDAPVIYVSDKPDFDPATATPSDSASFSSRMSFILWALLGIRSVIVVDTVIPRDQDHLDELYGLWMEDGYEGQMIRLDTPYAKKRGIDLIKRKEFEDDEFEITRVGEGQGNWAGAAKKLFCIARPDQGPIPDFVEFDAGMAGTYERGVKLLEEAADYVGGTATIRYFGYGRHGRPRFPVVHALYKRGDDRHSSQQARPAPSPKPSVDIFE